MTQVILESIKQVHVVNEGNCLERRELIPEQPQLLLTRSQHTPVPLSVHTNAAARAEGPGAFGAGTATACPPACTYGSVTYTTASPSQAAACSSRLQAWISLPGFLRPAKGCARNSNR